MRKKKDESEELGVFLWCERVRLCLDLKEESPHHVEAVIKKRLSDGFGAPNSRWLKYEKNGCVPRRTFGLAIERVAPGSWPIIDNPLWASLRKDFDVEKQANKLLHDLAPKIRNLVFDPTTGHRKKITHGLLNRLQKRLCQKERFHILACFVILLHEAHKQVEASIANLVGSHIQHALLSLLGAGIFGSFSSQFLEIFHERIFPLSETGVPNNSYQLGMFCEAIEYIQIVLLQYENREKIKLSGEEKISFIQNFIWRDLGMLGTQSIFWKLKRPELHQFESTYLAGVTQ